MGSRPEPSCAEGISHSPAVAGVQEFLGARRFARSIRYPDLAGPEMRLQRLRTYSIGVEDVLPVPQPRRLVSWTRMALPQTSDSWRVQYDDASVPLAKQ